MPLPFTGLLVDLLLKSHFGVDLEEKFRPADIGHHEDGGQVLQLLAASREGKILYQSRSRRHRIAARGWGIYQHYASFRNLALAISLKDLMATRHLLAETGLYHDVIWTSNVKYNILT
jgi:hypothetical protein